MVFYNSKHDQKQESKVQDTKNSQEVEFKVEQKVKTPCIVDPHLPSQTRTSTYMNKTATKPPARKTPNEMEVRE